MAESLGVSSENKIDTVAFAQLYEQSLEDEGATDASAQTIDISGRPAMHLSFEWHHEPEDDDKLDEYRYEIDELVFLEDTIVEFVGVCSAAERSQWEAPFAAVLFSITIA